MVERAPPGARVGTPARGSRYPTHDQLDAHLQRTVPARRWRAIRLTNFLPATALRSSHFHFGTKGWSARTGTTTGCCRPRRVSCAFARNMAGFVSVCRMGFAYRLSSTSAAPEVAKVSTYLMAVQGVFQRGAVSGDLGEEHAALEGS
jgi:hypothetical protein